MTVKSSRGKHLRSTDFSLNIVVGDVERFIANDSSKVCKDTSSSSQSFNVHSLNVLALLDRLNKDISLSLYFKKSNKLHYILIIIKVNLCRTIPFF